jgi:hypothetical protein
MTPFTKTKVTFPVRAAMRPQTEGAPTHEDGAKWAGACAGRPCRMARSASHDSR